MTKKESTPIQRAHSLITPLDGNPYPFRADKSFSRQDSKLSGVPDFSIVSPNNIMTGSRHNKLAINPSITRSLFNNSSAKSSFELYQPNRKPGEI
jgi:hypothetical protein